MIAVDRWRRRRLEVIPGRRPLPAADAALGLGEKAAVPAYSEEAMGRLRSLYQVGDCINGDVGRVGEFERPLQWTRCAMATRATRTDGLYFAISYRRDGCACGCVPDKAGWRWRLSGAHWRLSRRLRAGPAWMALLLHCRPVRGAALMAEAGLTRRVGLRTARRGDFPETSLGMASGGRR